MARNTAVQVLDDLTGEPAGETVGFALDGIDYDIDLSFANADELRALLARYAEAGRRTGGRKQRPRLVPGAKRRTGKASAGKTKTAAAAKKTAASTKASVAKKPAAEAPAAPKAAPAKKAAAAKKPAAAKAPAKAATASVKATPAKARATAKAAAPVKAAARKTVHKAPPVTFSAAQA